MSDLGRQFIMVYCELIHKLMCRNKSHTAVIWKGNDPMPNRSDFQEISIIFDPD